MHTNGNALYASPYVSDENSDRADLPRNRFVAGDFDGVCLNFWRPWGAPLHNGEPGDVDQNSFSICQFEWLKLLLFRQRNLW